MRRYGRVYRTFFVTSLTREMEFRANFFAKVLQNCTWVFFFVMVLLVVYRNTDSVAGWLRGHAFVLGATVFLLTSLVGGLFFSLMEIPQHVRMGTLDFVLTKPIDSQFWVSLRRFNFDRVGALLSGVALLAVGLAISGLQPSLLQLAGYFGLVFASLAIFYSVTLMMMTLGIWFVRVDNLWVLTETVLDVARFPTDIFPRLLQRIFVFGVPLAFLATMPSRQLIHGFDGAMLGLGLFWGIVLLACSRWFWRFATRHYTSASS